MRKVGVCISIKEIKHWVGGEIRKVKKSPTSLYQQIFEHSAEAIVLTDRWLYITDINLAGIKLLGYENREDALRRRKLEDHLKGGLHLVDEIRQKGYVQDFEVLMRDMQKREFPVLISANATADSDDRVTGYVAFIRNLSAQKKVEAELRQLNRELETLNNISKTVSDSLLLNDVLNSTIEKITETLDVDSVRVYLLDEEQKYLYLAAHRGLSEEFTSLPHIQLREVGNGILGYAAETNHALIVDDLKKSSTPFRSSIFREDLTAAAYIPLIAKGQILGVICVSTHFLHKFTSKNVEFLTAIGAQVGMAVQNAHLFAEVKHTYEELQLAQQKLVQSETLASLGKLAATIAHEINNPLTSVFTYTRLILKLLKKEKCFGERIHEVERFLRLMESETTRCCNIVKSLLAFSRKSVVDRKPNDVKEIIDRAVDILKHKLKAKNIRLARETQAKLPMVLVDFDQLQQVILNLLTNAIEAVEPGGSISITTRASDSGEKVEINVSDNGRGIDPEHLPHIFEPFYTTKEECKGVGLGLAIAFGIIKQHKGEISVHSTPGKGTTFTLRLPVKILEA
ncbi:MAG TPA: GAF domain-containing protein [Deltaproteobacteria bacterium]|nr:MAG: hypothetical protein DRG83_10215 [Deltaproteobacteria bacterium]RLB08401.1 MAG: hypothetical protein DRG59_05095 [Deltaproteobacteria bacterium]HDM77019.1 GAF domain-containing protein [Deltaproteobacteria bacterium]